MMPPSPELAVWLNALDLAVLLALAGLIWGCTWAIEKADERLHAHRPCRKSTAD